MFKVALVGHFRFVIFRYRKVKRELERDLNRTPRSEHLEETVIHENWWGSDVSRVLGLFTAFSGLFGQQGLQKKVGTHKTRFTSGCGGYLHPGCRSRQVEVAEHKGLS